MHRWVSLLASFLLAFALLTGGTAHAAEKVGCVSTTSEASGYFDGNCDDLPSGTEQRVADHHAGCSGHQFATSNEPPDTIIGAFVRLVPVAWREAGVPARGPDCLLRPPIA